MAGTEASAAAAAADATAGAAKKAAEAVAKVVKSVESAAPVADDAQSPEATWPSLSSLTRPPEVAAGLSAGAAAAVERFRSTSRWMLGAFTAVGVVVFGSIPFSDVTEATGDDLKGIALGLVLSALGIAVAIWAVSRVSEPEDASLGELILDFEKIGPVDDPNDRWWLCRVARRVWRRFRAICSPRRAALVRLKQILTGNEAQNHLGPSWPTGDASSSGTVAGLVDSIGAAYRERYAAASACAAAEAELAVARTVQEAADAKVEALWARWEKAATLAKVAKKAEEEVPSAVHDQLQAAGGALGPARQQATLAAIQVVAAERRRASQTERLGRIDARLAVHLQHRDLVITESGVSQLRGTFRTTRIWLVIGAILTAVGAALYAVSLPGSGDTASEVVMRFTPGVELPAEGTPVGIQIVDAGGRLSSCSGELLRGRLVGEAGAVSTVITSTGPEECQGEWVLPAGSWYQVDGEPLPAPPTVPTPPTTEGTGDDEG